MFDNFGCAVPPQFPCCDGTTGVSGVAEVLVTDYSGLGTLFSVDVDNVITGLGVPTTWYALKTPEEFGVISVTAEPTESGLRYKTQIDSGFAPQSPAITTVIHGLTQRRLSVLVRDNNETWFLLSDVYPMRLTAHSDSIGAKQDGSEHISSFSLGGFSTRPPRRVDTILANNLTVVNPC